MMWPRHPASVYWLQHMLIKLLNTNFKMSIFHLILLNYDVVSMVILLNYGDSLGKIPG